MNGPGEELQGFEISDSGHQLDDVIPWIEQDLGQACLSTTSPLKFTVVS